MSTPTSPSRRDFLVLSAKGTAATALLAGCGSDEGRVPEFGFGVASGDPAADRVILWTHARFPESNDDVPLEWEVARDSGFATIVASGRTVATAATAHTAKVDAAGLSPGMTYHFRFRHGPFVSPTGVTRTLPAAGASRVRFAVLSCSNYPAGYFNVYAEAAKSGADFALHLGDYIYEYGVGGYASADAAALGRQPIPAHECVTLDDYRRRYAQYRADPDSKALHAAMPLIAVWDDHELANDSWRDGAQNHTEGAEGRFVDRRAAALRAWHEWMPVRTPSTTDLREIWRSFDFGGILSLHMLETRLAARDRPISFSDLLNPTTASQAQAELLSTSRSLLGEAQFNALRSRMAASNAPWQVLGQQVLMMRMLFPVSVLRHLDPDSLTPAGVAAAQRAVTEYLTAKTVASQNPSALTAEQRALLDPRVNPRLGYNLDAWDGYPAERERLLLTARALGKRVISLAGDTHNAWSGVLTLADGTPVGHEFATPAVSSPGLEDYLATLPPAQTRQIFLGIVDDLQLADTERRGYLLLDCTPTEIRGQWNFVSTVKQRTYTVDRSTERTVRVA